jgi:predicted nucleic acid-binding Zn ribbon protein
MAKVITKAVKMVDEIIDHKCDICGNIIPREYDFRINEENEMNILKYIDGWDSPINIEQHICSKKCLIEALQRVSYTCDLHLTHDLIKEIVKSQVMDNA